MFIVWQGNSVDISNGVVVVADSSWMNRIFTYTDIIGCTIKSKNGIRKIDGES